MTIEVPDSMVPEGFEATGEFRMPTSEDWWISGGDKPTYGSNGWPRVILRRKPRLKKIVFTVAGEPRSIKRGEWYLLCGGRPAQWDGDYDETPGKFTPLERLEVYE